MKTGTITCGNLAERASVHPRTILRMEKKLGLVRTPGAGKQVIYQFTGTEEALIRRIKAPYRRPGNMRLSLVPDPAFVRREITRACGPLPEIVMNGCMLTLAMLAEMSLYLGYEAGVQINAQRHQRLVGSRHHKAIINILLKARLIVKVRGYKVEERCNSYRLTDASMSGWEEHPLWWPVVKAVCVKKASIDKVARDAGIPFDSAALNRLKMDCVKFTLPSDLDMEAIVAEQAEIALRKAKAKRRNKDLSDQAQEAIRRRSRFACTIACERYLADPLSLFRLGGESQRLFHPIALMPQRLRARLRCLGESVVTLDIRCCQPFLLGLLLRDNGGSPIPPTEFEDYMRLTVSGRFYEELGCRLTPPVSREEAKRLCYRDLFFGKQKKHTPDIVKAFAARFPAMGRALTLLRQTSDSLAGELQRSEARLIVGRVLPVLQAAFPLHPITIVHDAVMVPRSIAAKVQALMGRTVEEATCRRAGIKAE